MLTMLHLTNGESAAGSLRSSGLPGRVIAWQDVLHEGPVPAGLTLGEMSDVRARFLADWGAPNNNFSVRSPEASVALSNFFAANASAEEAPFIGDTTLDSRLETLIFASTPLVTPEPYALTEAGWRVLAGEVDARQLNGIDRWIGGVRFKANAL